MPLESILSMDASNVKFGPGATREVGDDMRRLDAKRVVVITDPRLADSRPVATACDSLRRADVDFVVFDQVRIEPSDKSFQEAIRFAADGRFDGYVAVGGGSTIDTAKAANLYATYPAPFLAYVNQPIGEGRPVPGKVKPLIAVPTTAGTGSETSGTAIFDCTELRTKTGIAHRLLRPVLGIIDPDNTRTMPKEVAVCSALDVLCHAVESLTALPFTEREAPSSPALRPAYQGANPISDIWASQAIRMVTDNLMRAVEDPSDDEARTAMLLASTYAGIGFGNAGVHLPHGMSYAVSSMVRDFRPQGYGADHPMIPHGMSVVLNAPAAFRFTAPANPRRHLHAAELMGVDVRDASAEDAGDVLAGAFVEVMKRTAMPNGLRAVGYAEQDVDRLVEGTLPQQRLIKLSPRPAGVEQFKAMFLDSMELW